MIYKYIYKIDSGLVVNKLMEYEDVELHYKNFPEGHLNTIGCLKSNVEISQLSNYRVVNNKLVKMTDLEIQEMRKYGKILTIEERQLQKLKPSPEEVRKAEQTIEILSLIQEVI